MKFYLVQNEKVEFSNPPIPASYDSKYYVREVVVATNLRTDANERLSDQDYSLFSNLLENQSVEDGERKKEYKTISDGRPDEEEPADPPLDAITNGEFSSETCDGKELLVAIGIAYDKSDGNWRQDMIRVSGIEKGNMLKRVEEMCRKEGLRVKLKVEIEHLTTILISNNEPVYTMPTAQTNEMNIDELSGCKGVDLHTTGYFGRCYWVRDSYQIIGTLSIAVKVCSNSDPRLAPPININKKILEEEKDTDAVITTSDNKLVKCHKCFLTAHSPVLEAMFEESGEVEMDFEEASVRALLAYLYYSTLDTPNCSIALDLLKAGHKYKIPSLEEWMRVILRVKPDNWYTPHVTLQLFLFVRGLDNGTALKMRALNLIKMNHASLCNSITFQTFFKENPSAALELYQLSFSL